MWTMCWRVGRLGGDARRRQSGGERRRGRGAAGNERTRTAGRPRIERAEHGPAPSEPPSSSEIDRLEAGGHDAPPRPHTRGDGAREGRPGAPLWRVVDFSPGWPMSTAPAWRRRWKPQASWTRGITPDGELRSSVTDDVVVAPGEVATGGRPHGRARTAVDRADPLAAALTDDAVTSVLRAVGLGPGRAAGSRSTAGSPWRAARFVAQGSAGHIGEGAREAARRARIQRLLADLAAGSTSCRTCRRHHGTERRPGRPGRRAPRSAEGQRPARGTTSKLAAEHEAKRRVDARLGEAVAFSASAPRKRNRPEAGRGSSPGMSACRPSGRTGAGARRDRRLPGRPGRTLAGGAGAGSGTGDLGRRGTGTADRCGRS